MRHIEEHSGLRDEGGGDEVPKVKAWLPNEVVIDDFKDVGWRFVHSGLKNLVNVIELRELDDHSTDGDINVKFDGSRLGLMRVLFEEQKLCQVHYKRRNDATVVSS